MKKLLLPVAIAAIGSIAIFQTSNATTGTTKLAESGLPGVVFEMNQHNAAWKLVSQAAEGESMILGEGDLVEIRQSLVRLAAVRPLGCEVGDSYSLAEIEQGTKKLLFQAECHQGKLAPSFTLMDDYSARMLEGRVNERQLSQAVEMISNPKKKFYL